MTLQLAPLKRFVDPSRPITYGIVQAGEHVPDGVPYIRPVDMTDHDGIPDPERLLRTSRAIAAMYSRSEVRGGDLIVSIGPSFGKVMIVPYELSGANLTQGSARVAPAAGIDARWLYWALQSGLARSYWSAAVGGATFRALNLGPLAATPLPVTDRDAQRSVAGFLDRETARIDGVVDRKQALLAVLGERRRAMVDRATVPGLAAGSDRWPLHPLRKLAAGEGLFTDGDWIETPYITDEGIRLIQTGNIGVGTYREQGFRHISNETFRQLRCTEVLPGDVLICRLAEPVGRACMAPDLGCRMITSVDVCILRPNSSVDRRFIVSYLSSSAHLSLLESIARGGTRDRVSRDQLGQVMVPLPPLEEQQRIASHIDEELQLLSTLGARLTEQIQLLVQHRHTLITAAVSGKLDIGGRRITPPRSS